MKIQKIGKFSVMKIEDVVYVGTPYEFSIITTKLIIENAMKGTGFNPTQIWRILDDGVMGEGFEIPVTLLLNEEELISRIEKSIKEYEETVL